MQRRGHLPDHVIADEDRQHEDGEAKHRGVHRPVGDGGGGGSRRIGELVGDGLGPVGREPGGLGRGSGLLGGLVERECRHGVPLEGYAAGWNAVWTIAPSRVRQVALTSSSSHFTARVLLSLSTSVSTKE